MPRFSNADDAFLKRTMLPRSPDCFFTSGDIELIIKETELKKEVAQNWARCLRWRINNNALPVGMGVEEFLKASAAAIAEKVMSAQ
jgi:hypothetical protein